MANIELYSIKADSLPLHSEPRPLVEQLDEAFRTAGLEPPHPIITDGKIHRFSTGNKQSSDDAGWYCIYGDNIPAGVIGNWRTGETHNFRADMPRALTVAEEFAVKAQIERARAQREIALKEKRERAAATVAEIWETAQPASAEHPYLTRKQVQTHGARIGGDGRLILPLYSADGSLSSLQYIDTDGKKIYHPGGAVGGCFYMLGDASSDEKTIYIAEGFATAATICEAMHAPTVAAYSANNLPAVTGIMRDKYPTADIVIVADNDASRTGENYANQAAAKHGARVIVMPEVGQDANDFAVAGGDLRDMLAPKRNEFSVMLDVISSEDISDEYIPPDEVIQNLFVNKTASVLYGASNSGKTFLSVAMAAAVSSGDKFLGLHVEKGDVLYVAAESPESIKIRIQAIAKETGSKPTGIHVAQAPVNIFLHPEHTGWIINAVKEIESNTGRKIRVIFFDTLARISAGANENTGEDMGPIMESLELIAKKTETAVVAIHHSGKDQSKGSRGWSGIYGAIDAEIEVKEDNGKRFFRVSKQRQLGSKEQVYGFDLKVVEMGVNKWGEVATTCVVKEGSVEKKEKLEEELATFIDCCRNIEKLDEIDGKLFVSNAALARAIFDLGYAKSETSAKQMVKPSAKGYLCWKLKSAGKIYQHNSGYSILDNDLESILRLGIKGIK